MTKTEVGVGSGATAVASMAVLGVGGVWKTLGLWIRNAVEDCKQYLLAHPMGVWKTIGLRAMWGLSRPKSKGSRGRTFATGLETILPLFWQSTWLICLTPGRRGQQHSQGSQPQGGVVSPPHLVTHCPVSWVGTGKPLSHFKVPRERCR